MNIPLILASQSPRRRELLTLIGIPHEVRPANVDESYRLGEMAEEHVERLAREKAAAMHQDDAIVIGSDTIVVVDDRVLGKPDNEADAADMLALLSGKTHVVMTAVAVAWGGRLESSVEKVEVTFHKLSDALIRAYIATGEPMDKAGAYGIQGFGATIVQRVDGDYFAVMGLPLQRLVRIMKEMGLVYLFGAVEAP